MTVLQPTGDRMTKKLALPPGRYEYRFVVDGQWGMMTRPPK